MHLKHTFVLTSSIWNSLHTLLCPLNPASCSQASLFRLALSFHQESVYYCLRPSLCQGPLSAMYYPFRLSVLHLQRTGLWDMSKITSLWKLELETSHLDSRLLRTAIWRASAQGVLSEHLGPILGIEREVHGRKEFIFWKPGILIYSPHGKKADVKLVHFWPESSKYKSQEKIVCSPEVKNLE